jgi:hypothetical protein
VTPTVRNHIRTFGIAVLVIAAYVLPGTAWDQALFGTPTTLTKSFRIVSGVATGDVNHDGRADIVAVGMPSGLKGESLELLAFFTPANALNVSPDRILIGLSVGVISTPRVADLDDDGFDDVTFVFNDVLTMAKGSPEGLQQAFSDFRQLASDVLLADMNGDGALDAVVHQTSAYAANASARVPLPPIEEQPPTNSSSSNTTSPKPKPIKDLGWAVRLGDGTGSFGSPVNLHLRGSAAVGDFNGDGYPDVVSIFQSLEVALGRGDGTFLAPQASDTAFSGGISVATGDVNGDGRRDVAVARSGAVDLYAGDGAGGFLPVWSVPLPAGPSGFALEPGVISLADLDRDGLLDLLIPSEDSLNGAQPLLLARGMGQGTFAAAVTAHPGGDMTEFTDALHVDLDGNGLGDLVGVRFTQPIRLFGVPTLTDYAKLQSTLAAHKILLNELQAEVKSLQNELTTTQLALQKARNERDGLLHKISALEADLVVLQQENGQLKAEVLNWQNLAKSLEQKVLALTGHIAKLEAQVSWLELQLSERRQQVKSLTGVLLGSPADAAAAQAVYDEAARRVHAAINVSPTSPQAQRALRLLADAEAAIARGAYDEAVALAQDAVRAAQQVTLVKQPPTNTTSPKPTEPPQPAPEPPGKPTNTGSGKPVTPPGKK